MADLIDLDAALVRIDCCLGNSLGGRTEFDNGLFQARKFVVATPAVNRWIPCSERLPEYGEYVLFIHKNCDVYVGYYDEKNTWNTDYQLFTGDDVTHWQYLPEPPEKE